MTGVLMLDSLTRGNTLKQGDKTPLTYKLLDADGDKLDIAGKSATVRLVYPNYLTIGYEKTGLTVASDDTVTFTIDKIIPARKYHVEIIVDNKFVFPSRSVESKFTIDRSSLGTEANIIEIVGKDVLINAVKSQVDTDLQPLVTSMEAARQAEIQRASVEASRVSAEEQREIDHANRSAELAGKADKVVIKNLIKNGDFSDGMTGWASFRATSVLEGGKALVTADGSGDFAQVHRHFAFNQVKGHKYYGASSVRLLNSDVTEIRLMILGNNLDGRIPNPEQNIDHLVSGLATAPVDNTPQAFIPRIIYPSDEIANGKQHIVNFAITLDLTDIFGAGNEPTKEEMDKLIEITGYIDGEYALNNKEMLGYLMKGIGEKANKKQEDWITPTLLNGWVEGNSGTRYFKDEFGIVHLELSLANGSGNMFTLPSGYIPISNVEFWCNSGGNAGFIRVSRLGTVSRLQGGGTYVVSNGLSFRAEG